jgi:predicted kinase
MRKPILIIVNGLPGAGKTTLAGRLARDLRLPLLSRDGIYETLVDALGGDTGSLSPRLGTAAFRLLYHTAASVLISGSPLIVEGFFGRPELRTAEFLELQHRADFQPFQILCHADGEALLRRFLARIESAERHAAHPDLQWLDENRERLLSGALSPLALDGHRYEIDTTTPDPVAYAALLQRLQMMLSTSD